RTLLDDKATSDQWLQAAEHIVETGPAGGARMRGEPLRGKTGPNVIELMARRVRDLSHRPTEPDQPDRKLETRLALALSRWDSAAAVPALRDLMVQLRTKLAGNKDAEAHRFWRG